MTTTPSENTDLAEVTAPIRPDWGFWQRRSYCRIWQAALLSLDVEPTRSNRANLDLTDPDRFAEYMKRREILIVNRGYHKFLTAVEHARAGNKDGEKYVNLGQVLNLAEHQRWSDIKAFGRGMSVEQRTTSASHFIVRDADQEEFDNEPKGEKYTIVRMGAVLTLLEKCLRLEQADPGQFLHSGKLNFAAVGRELEETIKIAAKATKPVPNYGADANDDAARYAVRVLQTFKEIAPHRVAKPRRR